MSENLQNWFAQNSPIEIFAIILQLIASALIAMLLFRLDHVRDLKGDYKHCVIAQAVTFPEKEIPGGKKVRVLRIRDLPPGLTNLSTLFQNKAAVRMIGRLAAKTNTKFPWLRFSGTRQEGYLHKLLSHFCANNYQVNSPLSSNWVFVVTREEPQSVPRSLIRCFFIQKDDLIRFLDEDWCKKLHVERTHHYLRVITLKRIAQEHTASALIPGSQNSNFLEAEVAIRTDGTAMRAEPVDWRAGEPLRIWEEAHKL